MHCPFHCNSRISHYRCEVVVVEVDDVLADRELEALEYSMLLELEEDDEAPLEDVMDSFIRRAPEAVALS